MLFALVTSVVALTVWKSTQQIFNDSLIFRQHEFKIFNDQIVISTYGVNVTTYQPMKNFSLRFGPNKLLEVFNTTAVKTFADIDYDTSQEPYSATIEYDRMFRVYNNVNEIVWQWVYPKVKKLHIAQNGYKVFFNYLRIGEYLFSDDENWFIMLHPYGQLIDNNGYVLAEAENAKVLELDSSNSLKLCDYNGKVVNTIIKNTVRTAFFDHTFMVLNNGKVALKTDEIFDLAQNGKPINEMYVNFFNTQNNLCLMFENKKLVTIVCDNKNFNQKFSDELRILSDPSTCLIYKNFNLAVGICDNSLFFKEKTLRTKNNLCLTMDLSFVPCSNQQWDKLF
jgi:hypothetical protein